MENQDDFDVLEQALINILIPDNKIIRQCEKIIFEVEKTDQCFNLFMDILFQSAEPNARNQASTQLEIILKSRLNQIDDTIKDSLKKSLIEYLSNSNNFTNIILNNIRECIKLLATDETWIELDEYIEQFLDTMDPYRLSILNSIIEELSDQSIEDKFQLYSQIVSLSIVSSDNFDINCEGISILAVLISRSESIEGFDEEFAKIIELIDEFLQAPDNLANDQSKFWTAINYIINTENYPSELITSITNFIMNPNITDSAAYCSIDAIIPAIKAFPIDQIFSLIHQIIFFCEKYIENEDQIQDELQGNKLPYEFMTFIEKCFQYFPHSQIYEYLQKEISDLLSSNTSIAILLFTPIILSAHEQITKDLDNLIDILKEGFSCEDLLIIEACSSVITDSDSPQIISKLLDQLFPIISPLLASPDEDIRKSAFEAMSSFFLHPDNKNDISIVNELWGIKENIDPDNYVEYFELLGCAISCSEPLDDDNVHEILESLQPMLENQESPDYALSASSSLFVISQLMCNGEFSEIESIIPSTLEATKYCLSFDNENAKFYALNFVSELANIYGEDYTDMLNEIWPFIVKIFENDRTLDRMMVLSLSIACDIAALCDQPDAIPRVLKMLDLEYETKHYQTFMKISGRIVKLVDEGIFQYMFSRIITICLNTYDLDDAKLSFRVLYKFLKHSSEESRVEAIKQSNEIINYFFEGTLPFLENMSVLDPEIDIDIDLVDIFCGFVSKFVSFQSEYVESVCENVIKLTEHDEDEYKNYVVQIFIDAIENATVPESISLELVENLEPFLSIEDDDIKQNIVYLMIVVLKQYPSFIDSLEKYIQPISNWWNKCMENTKRSSLLISNIASLFLKLESLTSSIPKDIMDQSIDFYPPSDLTEAQGMTDCILIIFDNQESTPLSQNFILKTAIGIAKLLTEPAKRQKKMNLQDETKEKITELLRFLCQNQLIFQAVLENLANNEKRHSTILSLLQS